MNTKQAADVLGIGYLAVGKLCNAGVLKAHKVRGSGAGGVWEIEPESVYARLRAPKRTRGLSRSLPAAPLLSEITRRGGARACGIGPHSPERKACERARKTGRFTEKMADRLCSKVLGISLWDLYDSPVD